MWKLWLILAGVCFIIESFTIGFFVFWFGIGALFALIISLFFNNFVVQVFAFIISSTLLLILTKPLVNKFIKDFPSNSTNVHRLIGKTGIVIEDINSFNNTGKIKINGEIWSATSDQNIKKDSQITIIDINGVKLKVTL